MPSDPARGPALELEWELAVFRGVRRLVRAITRSRARPEFDPTRAARLEPLERKLTVLAQIVAGSPVRVRAAARAGGVVGTTLYLPRSIDVAATPDENARLYVVRTVVAAALFELGVPDRAPDDACARAQLEIALVTAAVARIAQDLPAFASTYALACRDVLAARPEPASLPGVESKIEALRRAALAAAAGQGSRERSDARERDLGAKPRAGAVSEPVVLWGELRCVDPRLDTPAAPADARPPERGAAQMDVGPVEVVKLVTLDPKELEDAVLIHSFEKVDTADAYHGGARNLDGSDELADHAEALEEVPLGNVVRSADPVHAVLRADVSFSADVPDVESVSPDERGVPYDEWDGARRVYRRGWCTVYPTAVTRVDAAWARDAVARNRALIRRLTRAIEAQRSRLAPQRAQPDGESIDLDAFVRHLAARGGMEAGAPRLYVRKARQRRDIATTVLLDVSLSSDAWVDDRRVLDVSREGVLVLGEVADALGDPLQVLCFASHTRNRCRVWEARGWNTPWAVGRARLGALTPQGYTRIGPALRHATRVLAEHDARHRLLLLVSDGKPTDYDRYEGRHGVADVRQAVREADRLGVRVHGLTVDAAARDYLPAMLGTGRWHVLRSVADLPAALVTAYASLVGA